MKGLRIALGFLTILPVGAVESFQPGDLGRSARWFPFAGLVLGLLLAAVWALLGLLFPDPLRSVLLVALWALLTGGLHLDGLADCGDGLLAPVSVERRLEILKDPRLGSFGGISLIFAIFLKVSAVMAVAQYWGRASWLPLVLAPVVARWLIILLARQPMARPGGLGAEFAAGFSGAATLFAAFAPLGVMALGFWTASFWNTLLAVTLAHFAALGAAALARNRLGGLTGDVLGLAVEVGEIAVLLAFAVTLP